MVVTRSQTKRSQANNANLGEVSSTYNVTPTPVMAHGESDITQGDSKVEPSQLECDLEKIENAAESGVTNLVVDDNVWQKEYNFDDDMFVGGKNKKKRTRSEKREAHHSHARTQSYLRSGFNLDISQQELCKLQNEDPM